MDASEKLLSNNDEYIELPRDLNVLANRLNASKAEALRNALLAKSNEERKNELIVYLAMIKNSSYINYWLFRVIKRSSRTSYKSKG